MATPPESLDEILASAKWVVEAEVFEVVENAPPPREKDKAAASQTGVVKVGRQVVKLRVSKVLLGTDVPREITAVKPDAPYALKQGTKGPFLLDAARPRPNILGKQGPDTWPSDRIQEALKR